MAARDMFEREAEVGDIIATWHMQAHEVPLALAVVTAVWGYSVSAAFIDSHEQDVPVQEYDFIILTEEQESEWEQTVEKLRRLVSWKNVPYGRGRGE